MSLLFIFFIVFLFVGGGGTLMSAVAGKNEEFKEENVKSRILYSYVNNSFLLITVYI